MENLTIDSFKEKVFDYEKNQTWVFNGTKPTIIDFYADWCAPCKTVAPILEELAKEYENKVDFYKVNIEEQQELTQVFLIQSVPSLMFIPLEGNPQLGVGAIPKEDLKKAIDAFLLNIAPDELKGSEG